MKRKDYEKIVVNKIDKINNLDEFKENLKSKFLYDLKIGECEEDFKNTIDDMYDIINFVFIDYRRIIKLKIRKINNLDELKKIASDSFKYYFGKTDLADVFIKGIFSDLDDFKKPKQEKVKILQNKIFDIYDTMFNNSYVVDYEEILGAFNDIYNDPELLKMEKEYEL